MSITYNRIEDKLEDFRLSGKRPKAVSLTSEIHQKLNDEMRQKLRTKDRSAANDKAMTQILGLEITTVDGPHMPTDGVLIHEME